MLQWSIRIFALCIVHEEICVQIKNYHFDRILIGFTIPKVKMRFALAYTIRQRIVNYKTQSTHKKQMGSLSLYAKLIHY